MKSPAQKLKISKFSADKQLVAMARVNVIFDYEGISPEEMIQIMSGGQSPRVRLQDLWRTKSKDEIEAIDGTILTVNVKDLYAEVRRQGTSPMERAFLKCSIEDRSEFVQWAMEHLNDPVVVPPTK